MCSFNIMVIVRWELSAIPMRFNASDKRLLPGSPGPQVWNSKVPPFVLPPSQMKVQIGLN